MAIDMGPIAHYLGVLARVLGRHDEADAHFAQAEEIHQKLGAPYHRAKTHLEWARTLLARGQKGDESQAIELLHQAIDTARAYGCAGVERDAGSLLASAQAPDAGSTAA